MVNPGRGCLETLLNAILGSGDICFLETGYIACGTRDSLKESSMGQRHCSAQHCVGYWLADAEQKMHSHCRTTRLSLPKRHTGLAL